MRHPCASVVAGCALFFGCSDDAPIARDAGGIDAPVVSGDAQAGADTGAPIDMGVGIEGGPRDDGGGGGDCSWELVVGSGGGDRLDDVVALPDGTVIAVGEVRRLDGDLTGVPGGGGAWALRVDAMGRVMWHHTYGAGSQATSAFLASDGDVVLVGSADATTACPNYHGGEDAWLAKIDVDDGAPRFVTCIGGDDDDRASVAREYSGPEGVGFHITGRTDSHSDGDIGPKHGGGGVDAPDVLNAFYFTAPASGGPTTRAACLGTNGPEAGFAFMADGVILASTFGDATGDLQGQPLFGFQDIWVARWPSGLCTAQSCPDVEGTRFGGDNNDYVVAATPSGALIGYTRSRTGPLSCPGESASDEQLWLGRLGATAITDLRCLDGRGQQVPREAIEIGSHIYVTVDGAPDDGDFAGAPTVGAGSASPGGMLLVFSATTLELEWTGRLRGGGVRGFAIRPDGCVIVTGQADTRISDGRLAAVPPPAL